MAGTEAFEAPHVAEVELPGPDVSIVVTVYNEAASVDELYLRTITVLDPVEETSVVIPARALTELSRILADVDDPVSIVLAHSRNQLLFHVEGIDLVTRLIDGQYPNYQSVLPASHATRAVLDREELLRAVRPAALIAHESANIVKLGVGLEGDPAITVSANAEVGDHIGRVEAAVEGDGTTIAFNARFLADVLTNVDAEQFALELNGPLSPGVFRPIGDDRYVHVVMPLRTTS